MKLPLVVLALVPGVLAATPRSSGSYTLSPEGFVSGGPQAASTSYILDSAVDPGGGPVADSAHYTLKSGYIGQLYDVTGLSVTPASSSVSEGATNQMEAEAVMDDASTLALDPVAVAWSVVTGPVSGVNAVGLAQTTPVFADTVATVRGDYQGLSGTGDFTVTNLGNDDASPVAGDGIDDAWQFDHFDGDGNGALDAGEAALAAPDANPDEDYDNNFTEWATGYDPNDPLSFFRLVLTGVSGGNATLELSKVVSGTTYVLEADQGLGGTLLFTPVPGQSFTPVSDAAPFEVIDAAAPAGMQFYRYLFQRSP